MTSLEANTHTFVVTIWREEGEPVTWRGHVRHVLSGRRSSFNGIENMSTVVASFLGENGVDSPQEHPDRESRQDHGRE